MHSVASFHNLGYRLNGQPLLNIDELRLDAGHCSVLSGANGSGKTTLMKILAGLLRPDSMQLNWQNSQLLNWKQARKLLHQHVVYLHQQPFLFDTTVSNNIGYGLKHRTEKKPLYKALVQEALEWAGLSEMAQRHARQLSGGEKQRLAMARAYVTEPSLMLMDEPMANMDQASRAQTYRLIHQLKEKGIAILISSHELEHIETLGDHHLSLHNGKLSIESFNPSPQTTPLRLLK